MIDNSFCACHWMSPIFKLNIFHFLKLHFQVKQINGDMGYGPPILQIIISYMQNGINTLFCKFRPKVVTILANRSRARSGNLKICKFKLIGWKDCRSFAS